jgi:hypothetical protein
MACRHVHIPKKKKKKKRERLGSILKHNQFQTANLTFLKTPPIFKPYQSLNPL